jgi:hypothetical protein
MSPVYTPYGPFPGGVDVPPGKHVVTLRYPPPPGARIVICAPELMPPPPRAGVSARIVICALAMPLGVKDPAATVTELRCSCGGVYRNIRDLFRWTSHGSARGGVLHPRTNANVKRWLRGHVDCAKR